MPVLKYSLLCADILVDTESNSTSFIRTVEHAVVEALPATLPQIYVGTMWEMESPDEEFTVGLQLVDPTGREETLGIQSVTKKGTALHKLNFQLPGINIEAEGRHDIVVACQIDDSWEERGRLPLYIFQDTPKASE